MATKKLNPKRKGVQLETRTYHSNHNTYLVFKKGNSYHVFTETEAKDAAEDLGQPRGNTTRMWNAIWKP